MQQLSAAQILTLPVFEIVLLREAQEGILARARERHVIATLAVEEVERYFGAIEACLEEMERRIATQRLCDHVP